MNKIMSKINIGLLSSSLYLSFQLFANILSTKIVFLPILKLSVDGGTIIYPLTFTLRDFVHKTWGKESARQLVIIAGLLNLIMIGLFWVVGKIPADPSWAYQSAYEAILLPVSRIVFASVIAQIISELIDTEVFSYVYRRFNDWLAALVSNFISIIFDSFIFSFLAFLGAVPINVVFQIILVNILVKLSTSLLSAPSIVFIPRTKDKSEI